MLLRVKEGFWYVYDNDLVSYYCKGTIDDFRTLWPSGDEIDYVEPGDYELEKQSDVIGIFSEFDCGHYVMFLLLKDIGTLLTEHYIEFVENPEKP